MVSLQGMARRRLDFVRYAEACESSLTNLQWVDRLTLAVEPLSSEFGGGAAARVFVNGRQDHHARGASRLD